VATQLTVDQLSRVRIPLGTPKNRVVDIPPQHDFYLYPAEKVPIDSANIDVSPLKNGIIAISPDIRANMLDSRYTIHMQDQPDRFPRQALEQYVNKCLATEAQPQTALRFKPYTCPVCGATAFEMSIEHHSGSTRRNFRGVIRGICSKCSEKLELCRFTGPHRQVVQEKALECRCGSSLFYAGECERIEDNEGLPGFVDEGIAVAACAHCGRLTTIVEWD
jgi:hypothetical protein